MLRVKIAELENHLGRYLSVVRAGEELEVMDRNKPIARISPITSPGKDAGPGMTAEEKTRLEELVRQGLIRPARGKIPQDVLRNAPPGKPGVLAALLEEREQERR
jgi:antitoxin (DNA-binding transcriptional repressor) of toxin-antitoxin stability system